MSLFGYKPKWGKAPWTRTPSGKRSLVSSAARSEKSANKKKAGRLQKYLQQNPMRKKSPKQAKSDRIYNAQAKRYLDNEGIGRLDMVAIALQQGTIKATCVHHARGRLGTLKFDERFWIPTTLQNSLWPHTHINGARRLGLIAAQGDWHRAPDDIETQRIKCWMEDNGV